MTERFSRYCRAREQAAVEAILPTYRTVEIDQRLGSMTSIGNTWSREHFDGDFYRSAGAAAGDLPLVNLVFVESHDHNTGASHPSSLGGGETDTHLIYEGLSRVDVDAVLSGA